MVCPCSRTELRRKPSTSAPERESRLPVGSSAKITSGRATSARAQATRCCWPPESWRAGGRAGPAGRPCRSPCRTRPGRACGRRSTAAAGCSPAAVSVGSRLNCWKMKPTLSRRSLVRPASPSPVTVVSPMCTVPRVTESSPARQCISVDLPEPDGPMIAVNRPRSNSALTPRSATTCASPLPYTFHTSFARAAACECRPTVAVTSSTSSVWLCCPTAPAGRWGRSHPRCRSAEIRPTTG